MTNLASLNNVAIEKENCIFLSTHSWIFDIHSPILIVVLPFINNQATIIYNLRQLKILTSYLFITPSFQSV